MSDFKKEIDRLIKVEGGYVNHPSDKGGPTKYGITKATLSSWRGKKVTANDVKNLKRSEAVTIYKAKYWDINRTSDIKSNLVAKILFDQTVNRGYKKGTKLLQEACNLFPGKKITVDGKVGNITIARVNAIHDIELGNKNIQGAQDSYVQIVKNNNSQLVFLAGWINRTQVLMDALTFAKTTFPNIEEIVSSGKTPEFNDNDNEDALFQKIIKHNPKINKTGLTIALTHLDNKRITNKEYMSFIDFDIRSSRPRFWVINLKTGKTEHHVKVAHGKYSDPNHDGYADKYSNIPGSGMSSLGAIVVGKPYGKNAGGWSKFPTATKLHGLEKGLNDNVEKRAVVFHSSKYVNDMTSNISGRSLGCPAVDDDIAEAIQAKIKNGSLMYIYDKDFIKAVA